MTEDEYREYRREAYRRMRDQMPELDELVREMGRLGFDPQGAIVVPRREKDR